MVSGIITGLIVFALQAKWLWFTQDDAYISYRYARNALSGLGLVFNAGERVEGYTNFLWVVWLMLCGKLGFSFDFAAKALGLASGAGMIVLSGLLARDLCVRHYPRASGWVGAGVAILAGVNGSLAYWSVSGLETALFGFLVTAAVWLWLRGSNLTIPVLALAIMTRPEGGLIWIALVVAEWVLGEGPKRALILFGSVAALLLPYGAFKLVYYGSLLPNPFYAKTGFAWEYFASGLEYAWFFLRHHGLWGIALIPVVFSLKTLPGRWRVVPILWLAFTLYIITVGGDVLRPHRFFVPVLPLFIISTLAGLVWIAGRFRSSAAPIPVVGLVTAALIVTSWQLPREILRSTRALELGLTMKMTNVANGLRSTDSRNFSLAASTIGKIGYELSGHRIIDMLGLTDSTVARHPETIPGNVTSWKERNFNATYVLSQDPDYVLYSTGYKPSAPAERALILHSKFRQNYYTTLFPTPGRNLAVHKRKGEFATPDTVWPSIDFAHAVNAAFNALVADQSDTAIVRFTHVKQIGPPDYAVPDAIIADLYADRRDPVRERFHVDAALAIDSFTVGAWRALAQLATDRGDSAEVALAHDWVRRLAPALLNW